MARKANTRPYSDYEWYATQFGGNIITEERDYKHCAIWASALIDQITSGRVAHLTEIPDFVKDAVCAASDIYFQYQRSANREAKSESNDGYSITYADTATERQIIAKAADVVKVYLSSTGLTYRGCARHPHRKELTE